MPRSLGGAPGFGEHPSHRISIRPAGTRWQAWAGDSLVADSVRALRLEESGYPPALYFPAGDVDLHRLRPVDVHTDCPFKGRADYLAVGRGGPGDIVAWSYPATYEEVAEVAGHVAFYADRVSLRAVGPQ